MQGVNFHKEGINVSPFGLTKKSPINEQFNQTELISKDDITEGNPVGAGSACQVL